MKNIGIHLEKITWENYRKALKLRVKKDQKYFVARNDVSLIHAFLSLSSGVPARAFVIYHGKTMVGFVQIMYSHDWTANEREDWLTSEDYKRHEGEPYYYIWRFMIDKRYQGKGYGKEAFKQILDYINTYPDGPANYVILSYEIGNEVGKHLYASFGFKEAFNEYMHEGDEVTAIMEINSTPKQVK